MVDHFGLLFLHALLIAVYFSFLWKSDPKERFRYFWKVLGVLVLGAIAVGWLMFPFPRP